MLSRLLFIVMFVIGCSWPELSAQEQLPADTSSFPDLLYLRDGSVLKGRLEVYAHGQFLIFGLSTGDRIEVPASSVRRVVQGGALHPPEERRMKERIPRPYRFREEGLYHSIAVGLAFGNSGAENGQATAGWSAGYSAGYLFNRWIGLGGGLGIDAYYLGAGEVVYPLFGEARGYLSSRKIAPYYRIAAGYGIAFRDEDKNITEARGGAYFQPSLGFRWGGGPGINLTTDLGFRYQQATYTREQPFAGVEREVEKLRYKRIVFQVTMVF